jgi:hypothetical protein
MGWSGRDTCTGCAGRDALLLRFGCGGMAWMGTLPVAEGAVAILGSPVVDFTLVAVCIAAIVAFTILFEIGLERLEHKLQVRLACPSLVRAALTDRANQRRSLRTLPTA